MDFVKGLLKLRPEKWLNADQALKHPWIVTEFELRKGELSIDVV